MLWSILMDLQLLRAIEANQAMLAAANRRPVSATGPVIPGQLGMNQPPTGAASVSGPASFQPSFLPRQIPQEEMKQMVLHLNLFPRRPTPQTFG